MKDMERMDTVSTSMNVMEFVKKKIEVPDFQRGPVWSVKNISNYIAGLFINSSSVSIIRVWLRDNPLVIDGLQKSLALAAFFSDHPDPTISESAREILRPFDADFPTVQEVLKQLRTEYGIYLDADLQTYLRKLGKDNDNRFTIGLLYKAYDETNDARFLKLINRVETAKVSIMYITANERTIITIFRLINKNKIKLSPVDMALSLADNRMRHIVMDYADELKKYFPQTRHGRKTAKSMVLHMIMMITKRLKNEYEITTKPDEVLNNITFNSQEQHMTKFTQWAANLPDDKRMKYYNEIENTLSKIIQDVYRVVPKKRGFKRGRTYWNDAFFMASLAIAVHARPVIAIGPLSQKSNTPIAEEYKRDFFKTFAHNFDNIEYVLERNGEIYTGKGRKIFKVPNRGNSKVLRKIFEMTNVALDKTIGKSREYINRTRSRLNQRIRKYVKEVMSYHEVRCAMCGEVIRPNDRWQVAHLESVSDNGNLNLVTIMHARGNAHQNIRKLTPEVVKKNGGLLLKINDDGQIITLSL